MPRKRKPKVAYPRLFEPDLGPRFEKARHKADLSLTQIGVACGVSRQAVGKWERIGVPAERALPIARLLGCPVETLRPDLYANLSDRR